MSKLAHRTIGETHPDSIVLASILRDAKVGDVVTYERLSSAIVTDVQHAGRARLNAARRMTYRDHKFVFGTILNVGLKRLSDAEIVEQAPNALKRARNACRREGKKLSVVDYGAFDAAAQRKWNATTSILGAIAHIAHEKNIVKVAERILESKSQTSLPLAKTLDAFKD